MQIDNFNLYLSLAQIIIFCPQLFGLIAGLIFRYLLTFSIENQDFYNHFQFLKNQTQWNNDN